MVIFNLPDNSWYNWFFIPAGLLLVVGILGLIVLSRKQKAGALKQARIAYVASALAVAGALVAFGTAMMGPVGANLTDSKAASAKVQAVVAQDFGQRISFDQAYMLLGYNSPVKLTEGRLLTIGERKVHDRTLVLKLRVTR
jgi:hypothetical protein